MIPNSLRSKILSRVYFQEILKTWPLAAPEVLDEGAAAPANFIPLVFEGTEYGKLSYSVGFTKQDPRLETALKEVAAQIAPLFAWTEVSWEFRLKILNGLLDLKTTHTGFDWVGMYRLNKKKSDELVVSAYIGEPTEHTHIPVSKGICGAAIRENQTVHVEDVKSDSRFIACSIKTQSEIVVPIRNAAGRAIAEIDIDSNSFGTFSSDVIQDVEKVAIEFGKLLS